MWTSVESPVGPLRVIAHRDAVTAIEFEGPREPGLSARSSVSQAAARSLGQPVGDRDDTDPLLAEVRRQLDAYFAKELKVFDLPVRPQGTPAIRTRRGVDLLAKVFLPAPTTACCRSSDSECRCRESCSSRRSHQGATWPANTTLRRPSDDASIRRRGSSPPLPTSVSDASGHCACTTWNARRVHSTL